MANCILARIHQQTASRRLLDRPARRETILRGAAAAFAEKGYSATSMEDVAAAAGITKLIVYRHFDSKASLYDAVLERAADRTAEEFVAGLQAGQPGATGVRSLLVVAREDPAAFTLLWRHAPREPEFAEHAERIRQRGVDATERLLASLTQRGRSNRRWAAETIVSYLVAAVLHWLETGDRRRDDEFAGMVARSLPAMVKAWLETDSGA